MGRVGWIVTMLPLPMLPLWLEPHDHIEPVSPPGGPSGVPASQSSSTSLPNSSLAAGWTAASCRHNRSSPSSHRVGVLREDDQVPGPASRRGAVGDGHGHDVAPGVPGGCRERHGVIHGDEVAVQRPRAPTEWPSGSEAATENVTDWPSVRVTERAAGTGEVRTGAWSPPVTWTTAYEIDSLPPLMTRRPIRWVPAVAKWTVGWRPVASSKPASPSRSQPAESTDPENVPARARPAPAATLYGPPASAIAPASGACGPARMAAATPAQASASRPAAATVSW